jgi:hypothetical protein
VRLTLLRSCAHVRVPWIGAGGTYIETLLQTLKPELLGEPRRLRVGGSLRGLGLYTGHVQTVPPFETVLAYPWRPSWRRKLWTANLW